MTDEAILHLPNIATIFEVGCDALVETTPYLRAAYPDAAIYAFDPDPRHAQAIAESCADLALNVAYYNVAVSDHECTTEFWLSTGGRNGVTDWAFSSSLRRPRVFDGGDWLRWKTEPVTVSCITLDSFCATHNIPSIDLLHLDVQSAEDLVLRGARRILPRTHYIYTEFNTNGYYENEPGLSGILAHLPGWHVGKSDGYNVLLTNLAYDN